MPMRPPKPCAHAGCRSLTVGPRCERHTALDATTAYRYDRKRRGTARERGYDTSWDRVRAAFLLGKPLCVGCKAEGRVVVAQDLDHIIPFAGINDPLRLDVSNLQGLCRVCHNRKTAMQRHA